MSDYRVRHTGGLGMGLGCGLGGVLGVFLGIVLLCAGGIYLVQRGQQVQDDARELREKEQTKGTQRGGK